MKSTIVVVRHDLIPGENKFAKAAANFIPLQTTLFFQTGL
jgi:hypothetical protein